LPQSYYVVKVAITQPLIAAAGALPMPFDFFLAEAFQVSPDSGRILGAEHFS